MLNFAIFSLLLHRYSRADDIVIGTPISGRSRTELESLIGFFLNTLALRVDFDEPKSFTDLVTQIKQTALAAFNNQELPFEKLVEELQPERNMSHTPVFQHMFIWQDNTANQITLPGLDVEAATLISHDTAKFDLTLAMTHLSESSVIEAGFEYNTDLFRGETIERMLGHFETLLAGVVANPDAPLTAIALLDESERVNVVERFNASEMTFDQVTVCDLVAAQVKRSPDAVAIRGGNETLSYQALDTQTTAPSPGTGPTWAQAQVSGWRFAVPAIACSPWLH